MASIVTITTAAETVIGGPDGRAEHLFTVSNTKGAPLRIGAQVLVEGQAREGWFTIQGEPERELASSGTDQIAVRMQAPPGTAPGPYKFRLLVYSVKRPGEDFTEGPLVAVNVPAPAAPPPKPVKTGGFPWWIVVVVAVLVIGGIAGWLLWPKGVEAPDATPVAVPEPIELAPLASQARWASGQLVDAHNTRNNQTLPWMGENNDARGFVRLDRARMEDGQSAMALRMHPMWVDRGTIKGWFPWVDLPQANNIQFEARIGFLEGARNTDGVTFMVWEHHKEEGREVWNLIASLTKGYTGRLQTITGDISHLAGQEVSMELRVDAGNSSGQDWAAWIDPRIVFRR